MADLETLRTKINNLGEEIKTLKSSPDAAENKDKITKLIADLLESKKQFSDLNNGIGVDGKPYEAPLSKAEKKKKAKAEKAAAAAAAGGGQKDGQTKNSENAAKKAAKKAEAKAKRNAYKEGKAVPTPSADKKAQNEKKTDKPTNKQKPKRQQQQSANTLKPFELAFNPNVGVATRFSPVVALSVAVLCNVAPDLTLTANHKRAECSMGTCGASGVAVSGDVAIARYIASVASPGSGKKELILGSSPEEAALVDMWVTYSTEMRGSEGDDTAVIASRIEAVARTIEGQLLAQNTTYLTGHRLCLADLCMFASLGFSDEVCMPHISSDLVQTLRWVKQMSSNVALMEAHQLALSIGSSSGNEVKSELDPLVEGMNPLEGGLPGRVVTRFPPEPSGYLHIGHAKAVLLNDYYARRYQGRLIVRFDDTNPSKEKEEFQNAIIDDLKTLGVVPDMVTHTSSYFGAIRMFAIQLIEQGLAFMDDTPQEKMQAERMAREDSIHRNQSVEEAKRLFDIMCAGKPEGAVWCLRAKIDMQSVNGTMRDPVLYRQNLTPHHMTGTQYKAYPTYDLACPIVDSIEGVTHALRTTEYNDRDEQYAWIQNACDLRRVRIHAFSRLNFINTELSKRKLTWFVENGIVSGWDDARFPTVRGVTRRGLNVQALRKFMYSQGASRRVVLMEWNKFWAENKKEIDVSAKRFMAIAADPKEHCVLKITNYASIYDASTPHFVSADVHPRNPSMGKRVMKLNDTVILEKGDMDGVAVGEDIVLLKWGVVKISSIQVSDDGETRVEGEFLPDGDVRKTKRYFTWLATDSDENVRRTSTTPCTVFEFDNLISKDKLEEGEDFKDFLNPNTMASSDIIGDAGLKMLQHNEVIQLERRGYYRVDRPYISSAKPLILYMIPDGKAKAMGGLVGKLAHR